MKTLHRASLSAAIAILQFLVATQASAQPGPVTQRGVRVMVNPPFVKGVRQGIRLNTLRVGDLVYVWTNDRGGSWWMACVNQVPQGNDLNLHFVGYSGANSNRTITLRNNVDNLRRDAPIGFNNQRPEIGQLWHVQWKQRQYLAQILRENANNRFTVGYTGFTGTPRYTEIVARNRLIFRAQ